MGRKQTKKERMEAAGRKRHKHNLRKKRKESQESMYEDRYGELAYAPNLMAMFRKRSQAKTVKETKAEKRAYRKLVQDRQAKKKEVENDRV